MTGYVTLGTRDLARGAKFYDALAGELGAPRKFTTDTFIAWGAPDGPPGTRSESFYAACFRDPDGNKLNAFVTG